MAEDEDRLARIERTLSQLQQGVRDGFVEVYKQLDSFRRDDERQSQHLQREMNTQANQLQVRLDDLHRRFTDLQERLTGVDGRIGSMDARLDTRLQGLDDRLNTRFMGVEGRLSGIEQRLDHKAGNWTVNLWGATLAILIGPATALVKLLPW
jgi:chromosome segregation ATPase